MRDLTHLKTFIIDSKDPKEIDDAFSLELIEGNKKKLWIHISNPCKLFLTDSKIDLEARSKFSTIAGPQGGSQLNGDTLKQEAQAEMEKLEQDIATNVPGGVGYSFLIG